MKTITILILITLIILSLIFLIIINLFNNSYVKINGHQFIVDVAKSNEQKILGLSIYKKLPQNKGMLFTFKYSDYYLFWMKGMKFPIDIIYINNNRIVDLYRNVPFPKTINEIPISIRPTSKANYVLEINAGLSQKYNFKKGDFVEIKL